MKRLYIIGIALTFLILGSAVSGALAQEPAENAPTGSNVLSKFYFGGNFGLQLGTSTLIDISPLIGYKVTRRLSFGVSPTYKFYKVKNYYLSTGSDMKTNVLGGSVFGRFMILENLFAHTEYELLRYKTSYLGSENMNTYKSFLVGGGYRQRISQNASLYLLLLWNLNDTAESPYTNPVVRGGITVGL